MYNAATGAFFTYDNVRSVQAKAEYVKQNGLGGIISWQQAQDKMTSSGKRDELTRAIKEALFGTVSLPDYSISKAAIDVSATVTAYSDSFGDGYEVTLRNNATSSESDAVLSAVEAAAETVKLPKLYFTTASGATFSTGGYGSGTVTNVNGVGIADLSSVYDNQTIPQGGTVTFKLKVTGTADVNDILSIELSQRISSTGIEISRQNIFGNEGPVNPPAPVNNAPVLSGVSNKTITVGDSFNALTGVSAYDM
jgi:chitinase